MQIKKSDYKIFHCEFKMIANSVRRIPYQCSTVIAKSRHCVRTWIKNIQQNGVLSSHCFQRKIGVIIIMPLSLSHNSLIFFININGIVVYQSGICNIYHSSYMIGMAVGRQNKL